MPAHEQIEELFDAAMQQSPGDRTAFLATADFPQPVKDAATQLIQAHDSESTLLNDNLFSDIAQVDSSFFDLANFEEAKFERGEWIGRFQIEEEIGKGGMSIVYRASQHDPIKRKVAIKVLRSSLLAPRSVMRFLREQQALALVSHPNIATLYEVGSTENGIPFAAMELVDGVPITEFCNQHGLTERQRLRLFLKVGAALSHSHKHGVIHRDAKPGNILVEANGDLGTPKLIDFGIAKIFNDEFSMDPTVTQLGQILGSPRYMSPEQLSGSPIDHRSDIYSLSLVLFELLTKTPYRNSDSTEALLGSINSDQTQRVSERLKEVIANDPGQATEETRSFIRFVSHDLDWIIAKALSRSPDDRYQSMDAFVQDIEASLEGRSVNVSKPSRFARVTSKLKSAPITTAIAASLIFAIIGSYAVAEWINRTDELKLAQQITADAQKASSKSNMKFAAANGLIMKLLANKSQDAKLKLDHTKLIPLYLSQVEKIEMDGGPTSEEHSAIYGILTACYAMEGEFEKSAEIIATVSDQEIAAPLKAVRNKICLQYQAEIIAKIEQLKSEGNFAESARQSLLLGRCCFALEKFADAITALQESIDYFDTYETYSADSLFARYALMDVFAAMGKADVRTELIERTKLIFLEGKRVDPTIMPTVREKKVFGRIMKDPTSGQHPLFDHVR